MEFFLAAVLTGRQKVLIRKVPLEGNRYVVC